MTSQGERAEDPMLECGKIDIRDTIAARHGAWSRVERGLTRDPGRCVWDEV